MFKHLPNNAPRSLTGWDVSFETPWYTVLSRNTWHLVTPTNRLNGAAVIAIDALDRVLLLEAYRPAIDEVCLEIPKGMAEDGESTAQTAAREFTEETGIPCAAEQLVSLGDFYPDAGILAHRIALFAFRLEGPFPEVEIDTSEIMAHRIMPLSQLEKMIASGLIADALTITAAARVRHQGPEIPNAIAGIEKEVQLVDPDGEVVITMRTTRPDWAFEQYTTEIGRDDLIWRFAPNKPARTH